MLELYKSGINEVKMGMLDVGFFHGRLVSRPIMRCDAERWDNAEMIWLAVKAGFSGTFLGLVLFRGAYLPPSKGGSRTRIAPSLYRA